MGSFVSLAQSVLVEPVVETATPPPVVEQEDEDRFASVMDGMTESVDNNERHERPDWLDPAMIEEAAQLHKDYWICINNAQVLSLFLLSSNASAMKLLIATRKSDTPERACRRYIETGLYTLSWALGDIWNPEDPAYQNIERVRQLHGKATQLAHQLDLTAVLPSSCPVSAERRRVLTALREDLEHCQLPAADPRAQQLNSAWAISQTPMALTQWMFVGPLLLHPEHFGVGHWSEHQLLCFVHLWRSIGKRLGVRDQYNLCSGDLRQTRALCWLVEQRAMMQAMLNVGADWQCLTTSLFDGLATAFELISYEAWLLYMLKDVMQLPVPKLYNSVSWSTYCLYRFKKATSIMKLTGPPSFQKHMLKKLKKTSKRENLGSHVTYVLDML